MNRFLSAAACLVFFSVFLISVSYAQMCEHMGDCMGGGRMMGGMQHKGMEMMHERQGRMTEGEGPVWKALMGLNLSDEQKDAVKAIRSRVVKEMIRKGADLRIAELEQRDLLSKDPVDMKSVEAKLRQIEALKTDIHLLLIKAMEEAKSKLTPEQKKKFMEALDKGPMMGGMGTMHGPDCGEEDEECRMTGDMKQHGFMDGGMTPHLEDKGK